MLGIKSAFFKSMFNSSAAEANSTRTASSKQVPNAGQGTDPAATSTVSSASDRKILENKSRKDRALALLRFGKNSHATPKAGATEAAATEANWHVKYSLSGLNAKFFEESILNSIRMDASDDRNWPDRIKDMTHALAKLKILGPDQIYKSLAPNDLVQVFQNILISVQAQRQVLQSRINETIPIRLDELNSKIEKISEGKKTASSKSQTQKILDTYNKGFKALELTQQALDDIEKQADRLLKIALEPREMLLQLRGLALRLQELDSRNDELAEPTAEQIDIANQIVDLFSKTADAGIDLLNTGIDPSNGLSTDEISYLTRAMGRAERFIRNPSLRHENEKLLATLPLQKKLAKQTAHLLHEPQQQALLTRLTSQETRLDEAINHLTSRRPDSATIVRESTEEVLNALRHIDPREVARLNNPGEAKKKMAKSPIADGLDRIGTKAETLRNIINNTLNSPEANSFTMDDRRQLGQTAKLLEHVQSSVSSL